MTLNLEELTELLLINDPTVNEFKKRVISSLNNADALSNVLEQHCDNQKQTNCYHCENEGACLIISGIAHLDLKKAEKAIRNIEQANFHFRSKDETWNSIIGLELLGIAYEMNDKRHQALLEYQQAMQLLKNYHLAHKNDYDLTDQILTRENTLNHHLKNPIPVPPATSLSTASPSQTDSGNTNSNTSSTDDKDYLTLFSIPIYGTVEAGLNGDLHIDHFGEFTIVNKVELQKQVFDIYSVHGTAPTDHQITVTAKKNHGWLHVHGLSMNGCDIPFDENDYVLFYKSETASHLDYVIASNSDPSGEIALMVKRFDAEKNQLLSKSKDTSSPYNPIPLDKDHQIVGVVIAVAKPSK
jgi:tetratricopeptide (TPR) repeat protein